MKDLHNHILFGIDDGSKNLEESIEIIKKAIKNGYTDLILTPHHRKEQNYIYSNNKKYRIFSQLQQEVENRNLPIHLYLGNEITVDDDFFYYLETNQILPIHNSRYMLLELPFFSKYEKLNEILSKLQENGFVPIIAHPERYQGYQIEDFIEMTQYGVLFQGNIGSLYGKYGSTVKEKLEEMLKRRMIHFMASDVHHKEQTSYDRIGQVIEKLELLTDSHEIALELVDGNIDKVLKDEIVNTYSTRRRKLKFRINFKNKNRKESV